MRSTVRLVFALNCPNLDYRDATLAKGRALVNSLDLLRFKTCNIVAASHLI